jgi:site-specific recombinase XerD
MLMQKRNHPAILTHLRVLQVRGITRRAQFRPVAPARFRDIAATRWLRDGIDVRTVQAWLGYQSLATTQKCLEPSKEFSVVGPPGFEPGTNGL